MLPCGTLCRSQLLSGKSKGGLSKGGLGPKGANWAKKGPFGAISALPPWVWGAEELVPIGPEEAPTGPEKAPISPEKARFPRKDFPPIFSENLGLKSRVRKGAGGINCHNFFFTPDRETRRIDHTQQRKAQQNEKCDNLRPRPPLRRPPFGPSD